MRDGRSFTTRRVVAVQHERPIFTLSASFQLDQPGVDHQSPMPNVPAPETLPTLDERLAGVDDAVGGFYRAMPRPIDLRYVDAPAVGAARTRPARGAEPGMDAGQRARCPTTRCCTSAC